MDDLHELEALHGRHCVVAPECPITEIQEGVFVLKSTVDEQVNRSLSTERMLAAVSGGFGTLALFLSLVGVYGVMSFVVTHRTHEIPGGGTPGAAFAAELG